MSSESSRFQHLLQPIRDLSKNWNIDLAQELEEYLDELEHLTIAFDQDGVQTAKAAAASLNTSTTGVPLMNFAEAALLIQGTSMIYSRKVEYLYALVFQTLAHLSKQQDDNMGGDLRDNDDDNENDTGDTGEDGKKKQRRKREALDVFANPLPIYDELDEARTAVITLKRSTTQQQPTHSRYGRADLRKNKNSIQASIALMGSLVPDTRDHGETFKLLSCHLHPSGVLLMDEASKKYLHDEQTLDDGSFPQTPRQTPGASHRLQHTPMAKLNFDVLDTSMASDDENNDPMDDDFGGGYDPLDDQDERQTEGMDAIFNEPVKPEPGFEIGPETGTGKSTTTPSSSTVKRGTRTVVIADAKDPWASLDAYDASKSTVRPFRKGRSYPARSAKKMLANKKTKKFNGLDEDDLDGVDDPAFKDRFLLSANCPQWSTWVWNDLDDRALETKFKKKYCKVPCLMTSCASLWRLETKWKSLMRKSVASEAQSAQAILLQEQAEEEEEQQLHAMATHSNGAGNLGMNDPFVSDPQVHDVDDEDDDDYEDGRGMDHGVDYDGGDMDDWGQNYALLDNTAVLKNGGVGQQAETQGGEGVLSYEQICRQHLEEFMKGTEQYMRETDLTRQVSDWQDKLSPILREQDAHPPFDIHKYGRNILNHLETSTTGGGKKSKKNSKRRKRKQDEEGEGEDEDDGSAVPFGEVVTGLSQFEVCRMFLASLQLANNGNVHLHHGKTAADQAHVPFEMQLLTTSNVYESIQHDTTVA